MTDSIRRSFANGQTERFIAKAAVFKKQIQNTSFVKFTISIELTVIIHLEYTCMSFIKEQPADESVEEIAMRQSYY